MVGLLGWVDWERLLLSIFPLTNEIWPCIRVYACKEWIFNLNKCGHCTHYEKWISTKVNFQRTLDRDFILNWVVVGF